MRVVYLDCTNQDVWASDNERRVKDKYFSEDPNFEHKRLIDDADLSYTIEDCALVRATGQFPFQHKIKTTESAKAYSFGDSIYMGRAIREAVKAKYPETYEEELKKYQVYCELHRDTIHFTINGLVQSSMYGDFEGRDYILIEPLKYHIDDSLRSLRPEDTFFKGNVDLSDESSLIIDENVFERIKDDPAYTKDLEKFTLFVYKGKNQAMAVKQALNHLGYDNFTISNSYYTNNESGLALQMTNFLSSFALEHNISQSRHCYTEEYQDEHEAEKKSIEEIDMRHLKYILEHGDVSQGLANHIMGYTEFNYTPKFLELARKVVDKIGLDELSRLTDEFNKQMISERDKLISLKKPESDIKINYYEEVKSKENEKIQEKTR